MKFSSAHVGLGAVLPVVVMATHPKEWEQQRQLFEKRTISNSNFTGNNGNLNGNTAVIDSNIASGNVDSGNEINSNNHVNINVALDPTIINNFNNGVINYYSNAPDCYYAKLCATCNIVKVSKGNNTYVDQPCATCPVETLQCPGYNTLKTVPHGTNGTAAVCSYQPAVCVTCQTAPPAPPPPVLTTVAIHCPTCPVPVTSQTITCPTSVASSVVSIASVSGAVVAQSVAVVAQSVAQQAVAITVTAASVVATPAPSTVVNAVCTTCPAGSQAVTVAQVTPVAAPTPASPGSPGTPGTPGSPASPGTPGTPGTPAAAGNVSTGTGPAPAHFTGSATSIVTSIVSVILGLMASAVMYL